jgi:hypothetical protein
MDPFSIGGVNMGNDERSGPDGRSDSPVRLATWAGVVAGAALGLFVIRPLVHIPGFWPGRIAFVAVTGVGGVLGPLVRGLLVRPSSGGPPDPPPHACPGLAAEFG